MKEFFLSVQSCMRLCIFKLLNTNLKMAYAPVCSACINNACDVAHCGAYFNRLHKRNDKRMEFPNELTNFQEQTEEENKRKREREMGICFFFSFSI